MPLSLSLERLTMDDRSQRLLIYDELPAPERAELDAYLRAHPEAEEVLEQGRRLRALLDRAVRTGAEAPDPDVIAAYVAARYMHAGPLPLHLRDLERRVEAAVEADPEAKQQYEAMQERLRRLTTAGESPREQFERLARRPLTPPVEEPAPVEPRAAEPRAAEPRAAEPRAAEPAMRRAERSRPASWRVPKQGGASFLRHLSPLRLALAAVLVCAVLYGGLYVVSLASTTPLQRLADLDAVQDEFAGLTLRGGPEQVDPAMDRYAQALEELREARSSFLGLFAGYDAAELDEARDLLEEVVELEKAGAALGLEARYLIGRIQLYQGDREAAREQFEVVVLQQGPSAPDARRLLEALEPVPTVQE